jgi:hypothetical protein
MHMNNDDMILVPRSDLLDFAGVRLDLEGDDDFFMENDDAVSKLYEVVTWARDLIKGEINCGTCSMPVAERHATWCPGSVT